MKGILEPNVLLFLLSLFVSCGFEVKQTLYTDILHGYVELILKRFLYIKGNEKERKYTCTMK